LNRSENTPNFSLEDLNQKFSLNGKIRFTDENGQVKLVAQSEKSSLECYLQGAHITSFKIDKNKELLWLSPDAVFKSEKAIRGGIPICWPWFGPHPEDPALPQHGFARNSVFSLSQTAEKENGDLEIILILQDSEASLELWPFKFRLEVSITMGAALTVEVTTHNLDALTIPISEAVHSYFDVDDIHTLKLSGLQNVAYYDQIESQYGIQTDANFEFKNEVDRIYQAPKADIDIIKSDDTRINITQENANAVVVWNPWIEKSKTMGDFPDDGYVRMVCIEAANVRYGTTKIKPGECHSISQKVCLG